MDIKHIKVGDIVRLKNARGFLRVDQIVGTELRQQCDGPRGPNSGGGSVTWLDADLVEEVGRFVSRSIGLTTDEERRSRQQQVDALRTPAGGWKRDSLASIGINWPPKRGWRKRYIAGEDPNEEERDA